MKTKINKILSAQILGICLLGLTLGVSTFAEAGRGHHRHHHHGHHYGHHHYGGYAPIYSRPDGYYYRPYFRPAYGYNYYPTPAPVYAPPPIYAYPPNVVMDINTGSGHFFFSY